MKYRVLKRLISSTIYIPTVRGFSAEVKLRGVPRRIHKVVRHIVYENLQSTIHTGLIRNICLKIKNEIRKM